MNLNYIWRVAATGLCFAVFGIGSLLLNLTVMQILYILPADTEWKRKKAQWIIHMGFRFFAAFMKFMGVMRLTVTGGEKLRRCGGCLIVANHPTLIDVVILISLLPKVDCVVKRALWSNPFLRGVVTSAGYIDNSDPENLLDECVSALKKGRSLLIFPEGTRTAPGEPMKFQRGAAHMALRSECDIIPVVIACTPPTLTKDRKWYEVPPDGRFHMVVKVGDRIRPSRFLDKDVAAPRAARRLTDIMYRYLTKDRTVKESERS